MTTVYHCQLEPWGSLRYFHPNAKPPQGHVALDKRWWLRLPPDISAHWLDVREDGICVQGPQDPAKTAKSLLMLWHQGFDALHPQPLRAVPVSTAGTDTPNALRPPQPTGGADDWNAQLRDYLASWPSQAAQAGERALEMFLRQMRARPQCARADLFVWHDPKAGWRIQLHQPAALLDLVAVTPPELAALARISAQPSVTLSPRADKLTDARRLVFETALLVEVAQMALASGLGRDSGLEVQLVCPRRTGLLKLDPDASDCRTLCVPQEGGLLRLMQLSAVLAKAIRRGEGITFDIRTPLRLYAIPIWSPPKAPPDVIATPRLLDWRPLKGKGADRGTYGGDINHADSAPLGLPFALSAASSRQPACKTANRAFTALSALKQNQYTNWLAGPRQLRGLHSHILELYLQGLEYRLLAQPIDAQERQDLGAELLRLHKLITTPEALTTTNALTGAKGLPDAILRLLDFAAVSGRDTGHYPADKTPEYRTLAEASQDLRRDGVLSAPRLTALSRILCPDLALTEAQIDACGPAQQRLPLPHIPLVLRYESLSGLCDAGRYVVQGACDLRQSLALRQLFGRMATGERV